ncbi:unnamed protein product [Diamesa serratosioi]
MSNSESEEFESADEDFEEKMTNTGLISNAFKVSESKLVHKQEVEQKSSTVENIPIEILTVTTTKEQQSWKSWGAFSLISNASKSVASITTQVSQHISSAIDNMNIPEPEQMAKIVSEEENQLKGGSSAIFGDLENRSEKSISVNKFNMGILLSGVSEMSSKMVSGGLGTLEEIGKKTIHILQENNPNIKNKILDMNGQGIKPNLSDVLKEAKDRLNDVSPISYKSEFDTKLILFEQLFDDYKGLVYIEAIKILSNQSKMKIESLIKPLDGKALHEVEETLGEVEELCELPENDNFEEELSAELLETKLGIAIEDLNLKLNFIEIVSCIKDCNNWLNSLEHGTINIIYEKSINVLANTCALSIGNLHKFAELLLCMDNRSTVDEADSLTQLVMIYTSLLNSLASKFSEKLTLMIRGDESKKQATNIFLECSTAINYIKSTLNLFIPLLQIGAI